jgi:hypothetical protein
MTLLDLVRQKSHSSAQQQDKPQPSFAVPDPPPLIVSHARLITDILRIAFLPCHSSLCGIRTHPMVAHVAHAFIRRFPPRIRWAFELGRWRREDTRKLARWLGRCGSGGRQYIDPKHLLLGT